MALNARTAQPAGGLAASLRKLVSSFSAILHTRVELIARELERERIRVTRLLLIGFIALFFFALGMITLTIFVIVLFWDSQRLVAIGFLTVLYLGIAGGLLLFAKRDVARGARPFASTVAELRKDRERFRSH
jgi:uncharacterized membrane protein YqjE